MTLASAPARVGARRGETLNVSKVRQVENIPSPEAGPCVLSTVAKLTENCAAAASDAC